MSSIIKDFIEEYFRLNNIDYKIEDKGIYDVNFTELHANKLGKKRRFSFNRTISDDYGIEYMSLNNDLIKFLLRESIKNGQVIKAEIDLSGLEGKKIKLDNNILIMSQQNEKNKLISFLFKISSTNTVSDNNPESLKYVVVDYDNFFVYGDEISEEFHNFKLSKANFKFNPTNINKTHTVAYETIKSYIESKYDEYSDTNNALYDERIKELKDRHQNFVKECGSEERKKQERINELNYRIRNARAYDTRKKYEDDLKKVIKILEELKKENSKKIGDDFYRTEKIIENEKEKFNFEVNLYLLSAVITEYNSQILKLKSTISNEETEISYNQLVNKITHYICPTCKKKSQDILLSLNGHFCCEQCATYFEKTKGYLCRKDDVERCIISGNFIPKKEEFKCYSCDKYFDQEFLDKDILGKNVCELCKKKTYNGEIINSKDAVYSKKYNSYFKPADVKKCEYSKEFYPLNDLVLTTGTKKLVAKEFSKICKITKLSFVIDEMNEDISKFASEEMKEIMTEEIKYPKIKEIITKNKIEFSENNYWFIIKTKGLLRTKYVIYDKKKEEIK